jgi:hypothetical protein
LQSCTLSGYRLGVARVGWVVPRRCVGMRIVRAMALVVRIVCHHAQEKKGTSKFTMPRYPKRLAKNFLSSCLAYFRLSLLIPSVRPPVLKYSVSRRIRSRARRNEPHTHPPNLHARRIIPTQQRNIVRFFFSWLHLVPVAKSSLLLPLFAVCQSLCQYPG